MNLPPFKQSPLNISMALPNNPFVKPAPPPNKFFAAIELDRQSKHKDAEKIFNELLNADFDNPIVLAALGMNLAAQEKNGAASHLLRKALENIEGMIVGFQRLGIATKGGEQEHKNFFATKRAECLNALGTCYKHENMVKEARELFEKAQECVPPNADIQNNLATLYINEGKPELAKEFLDKAILLQPDHPQAKWNRALANLEMGDYAAGWSEYDAGFPAKVRGERNYSQKMQPTWDGSPGKTIVVYGEQGIGDEIMFASCLPDLLKCSKKVVFDCHKKLHTLFSNTWPELDIYPTREDDRLTWPADPQGNPRYPFDCKIALGSLPFFFRPTLLSFPGVPYIKPPVAKEAEMLARLHDLGPRPKIGISWIGGHKRTRVEVRSLKLEQMLPILKLNADFISLQYTDQALEISDFEQAHGIHIHQFPEEVNSPHYADTAALVANLDLVITVCTSVVHLAGSMGVPTWVLTPSRPAWRYRLDLDYMPWYGKTITLFRQVPGSIDWNPVVSEVADNLKDLLSSGTIAQTPARP